MVAAEGAVVPSVTTPAAVFNTELRDCYRAHYGDLVRLACLLVGDRNTGEELVQDAFVRTLVSWPTIREPEKLPAFLRSVVINGARSRLRRHAVARKHLSLVFDRVESKESEADAHHDLMSALRRLSARQRETVVLRYYVDLTEAEIASLLGISAGAVKTHLHRGLRILSQTIESRS